MQPVGHNEGVRKHPPVTVDPVRFVLHGVDNDVLELVEQHLVQETGQARPSCFLKPLVHVRQCFLLRFVEGSIGADREARLPAGVVDETRGGSPAQRQFHVGHAGHHRSLGERLKHTGRSDVHLVGGVNDRKKLVSHALPEKMERGGIPVPRLSVGGVALIKFHHRLRNFHWGSAQTAEAFVNKRSQPLLAFGLHATYASVPAVLEQTTDPRIQLVFKEFNLCSNGRNSCFRVG